VQITEVICLWYGSFRSQTVRVILVRDDKPRTRDRDDRGYGLPLVTTDLSFPPPAGHLGCGVSDLRLTGSAGSRT
jgi:hypothetical protein